MDRDGVIEVLRRYRPTLEQRGVRHAALFGSVARGEQKIGSDIDILIDVAEETGMGVYEYVGLTNYISDLFEGPVDVVSKQGLKDHLRHRVLADAIYAF